MKTINIVLLEPEIPQNTGNIARTCAATGAALHLIHPLGFEIDDKKLKRAGLDYWNELDITYYDNLADFFWKESACRNFLLQHKSAARLYRNQLPLPRFLNVRERNKRPARRTAGKTSRPHRAHPHAQPPAEFKSFKLSRSRRLRGAPPVRVYRSVRKRKIWAAIKIRRSNTTRRTGL